MNKIESIHNKVSQMDTWFKKWCRRIAYWQENGRPIKPMKMQSMTCKHCGIIYQGNYCPRCGQSRAVSQITKRGFVAAFMEAYPQLASTFLRTLLELLYRPGYMIRDYFRGHRVIYSGPFKTFIIIVSIFVIVTKLAGIAPMEKNEDSAPKTEVITEKTTEKPSGDDAKYVAKVKRAENIGKGLISHQVMGPLWSFIKKKANEEGTIYIFLCVPFMALASKLAFRKRQFDGRQLIYAEHFMVFTYLYAINICFSLIYFALNLGIGGEEALDYPFLLLLFYLVWIFKTMYGMGWKDTIKRLLAFSAWTFLFFTLAIILIVLIALVVFACL